MNLTVSRDNGVHGMRFMIKGVLMGIVFGLAGCNSHDSKQVDNDDKPAASCAGATTARGNVGLAPVVNAGVVNPVADQAKGVSNTALVDDKPAKETSDGLFARNNLVAWCIVPFDKMKRGPEERAEMLNRLGITRLAYDWRNEHVPTFDRELDSLQKHHIRLQGFWLYGNLAPEKDKDLRTILDLLGRRKVKTEIWLCVGGAEGVPEGKRVVTVARAVRYVAQEARKIDCQVGLYNHGGWFGEPENQIAIIEQLRLPNVGIVYNFHHGHGQMDRFAELFAKMKPYLYCVNLNGMQTGGPPSVMPIGQGDREQAMIKIVHDSGYQGPSGSSESERISIWRMS